MISSSLGNGKLSAIVIWFNFLKSMQSLVFAPSSFLSAKVTGKEYGLTDLRIKFFSKSNFT